MSAFCFSPLATVAWSATFSLPILPQHDSIYRGLRTQGWSEAKGVLQVWNHGHFSRLQPSELRSKMPLDSGWIPSELLESHSSQSIVMRFFLVAIHCIWEPGLSVTSGEIPTNPFPTHCDICPQNPQKEPSTSHIPVCRKLPLYEKEGQPINWLAI